MKIVQLNTVCGTGSTGKIVVSLHNLSTQNHHESYIAYGRNSASQEIPSYKIGNKPDFYLHVLKNFFEGKNGFGSKYVSLKFIKWLDCIAPDIIHLHNIHGFYLNIELLFDYIKEKNISVIWTLHDCWPFTGQCAHFDYANCLKWKTGCYACPIYRTNYPYSLFKDNSKWNYSEKKRIFSGINNLIIVTPSHWLADLVSQSFLQDYQIKVIPNGIDLEVFKPLPKQSSTKKIILGVANSWTPQKGYDTFIKLSEHLDSHFQIVLIGVSELQQHKIQKKYPKITAITRTKNQQELAQWYSDAYVYINPTLEDNFPTTNLEALACGTPVITYNTGGSPESITPECGIIVEKGNFNKLLEAILSLEENLKITPQACRKQALFFEKDKQFKEYIQLYELLKAKESTNCNEKYKN